MSAPSGSILVLDDERPQREIITLILREAGYEVAATGSPVEALQTLESGGPFDLVLCDLRMPIMGGIEFLERALQIRADQMAVVVTAHGSIPTAVEAIKKGAFHYLTKPLDRETFLIVVRRAVEQAALIRENKLLQSQIKRSYSLENIVGRHGSMQELFRLVEKVAPTNTAVLLYGESGTGKELVARAIHQMSPRAERPMQAINCAAIPEALLESELFGYEKGAFTGAQSRKKGLFEQSSGTTLLLDEVGDLELQLQAKILRVLQEKELTRLGGGERVPVDVRIISSTHRDLSRMVREGSFREDLYYRLNTFPLRIPALRERATDIPLLVEYFTKRLAGQSGSKPKRVEPEALRKLMAYNWPGNVRQLESAIERAVILTDDGAITERELPEEIRHFVPKAAGVGEFDLPRQGVDLEELEKHLIQRAMERSGGVIAKAAPLLGLTYRTLQYRLQKYGLSASDG